MEKYCKPAPYGDIKEQKTVYNKEVRLASELDKFLLGVIQSKGSKRSKSEVK